MKNSQHYYPLHNDNIILHIFTRLCTDIYFKLSKKNPTKTSNIELMSNIDECFEGYVKVYFYTKN